MVPYHVISYVLTKGVLKLLFLTDITEDHYFLSHQEATAKPEDGDLIRLTLNAGGQNHFCFLGWEKTSWPTDKELEDMKTFITLNVLCFVTSSR